MDWFNLLGHGCKETKREIQQPWMGITECDTLESYNSDMISKNKDYN